MTLTPIANNSFVAFNRGSATSGMLPENDDQYSGFISLTPAFESGLSFNGRVFTGLYVNTNGNVTFEGGLSQFTPNVIGDGSQTIVAPFWGDVDTRGPGNGDVYWDFAPERDSFIVTWQNVGYYYEHVDKLNSFQLELHDQGAGNFEIIYRYGNIDWTTGDASGGSGGYGGTVARAGFSSGNGLYFELPQSGNQTSVLNLENTPGNTGVGGVWQFEIHSGGLFIHLGDGNNIFFGGIAADIIYCGLGNDTCHGNGGNDQIFGEFGRDFLFGDAGRDLLNGGADRDFLVGGLLRDILTGGSGRDVFDFNALVESRGGGRDFITDFRHGQDDINLRDIDANSGRGGNQNFIFIGAADFHHRAGEVCFDLFNRTGSAHDRTIISADVNGDGRADFQIELKGIVHLTAGDFVL